MSTVHVCPDRDIECGNNPKSWCDKCPKREPTTIPNNACTNCGISGIHACLGLPIHSQSQNSISELERVLRQYPAIPIKMPPLTKEHMAALVSQFQQAEFDPLGGWVSTHTAVQIDPRISAFEAIKAALDDPNQDGVLAKIRRIASLKD